MCLKAITTQSLHSQDELLPKSRSLYGTGRRVLNVIDKLIKNCFVIQHIEKLQLDGTFSKDMVAIMQDYITSCNQYNELSLTQNAANPSDGNEMDYSERLNEVEKEVSAHTRQLLRQVRASQEINKWIKTNIVVTPKKEVDSGDLELPLSVSHFARSIPHLVLIPDTNEPEDKLTEYLLRLRSLLFMKMLATPEDTKRMKNYVKGVRSRLKDDELKNELMQRELEKNLSANKTNVDETKKVILALEKEINNLDNYLKGLTERTKLEEAHKSTQLQEESTTRLREMEAQLEELRTSHQKTVDSNSSEENVRRGVIYRIETEIESIINKYDQEMIALQTEYDTLDEEYTKEKKELSELEERFLTLEEEYLEIMEERRIQEENRQKEEAEKLALEQSVITIQAFWRSYKTRKVAHARASSRKRTRR